MSKISKFRFKLPKKLHGKKLCEIAGEIEASQPIEEGNLTPILTNYGCAGFHFYYDDEKLLACYGNYVSKEDKELEKLVREGSSLGNELTAIKYKGVLDRILSDHPDVVSSGLIQVVLTTVPLEVDYKAYELDKAVKSLERNLETVKAIAQLGRRFD